MARAPIPMAIVATAEVAAMFAPRVLAALLARASPLTFRQIRIIAEVAAPPAIHLTVAARDNVQMS